MRVAEFVTAEPPKGGSRGRRRDGNSHFLRYLISTETLTWESQAGRLDSMSASGPSCHFATTQQLGRFRSKADMDRQAKPDGPVENDPKRTFVELVTRRWC
jgi:hypothetical protein